DDDIRLPVHDFLKRPCRRVSVLSVITKNRRPFPIRRVVLRNVNHIPPQPASFRIENLRFLPGRKRSLLQRNRILRRRGQDAAAPPAAAAKETTIKMGLEAGRTNETGRDTRVFTIPIMCGDAKANFTWGCGGQTIISAAFAEKARLQIRANDDLKAMVDGNG